MVEFSLRRYKSSITALRTAVGMGVPENREGDGVVLDTGSNHFLINRENIYLTHQRLPDETDWNEITRHNYSQMGLLDSFEISGGKINRALDVPTPAGTDLALVIIATAEAVRSRVVYQMVQQMKGNLNTKVAWGDLKPLLIGSWIENIKENHKRRPIEYGALGPFDYYNRSAKDAIRAIQKSGINIQ